eukprot:14304738-Alexandrium_andersonii.AAC.1
MSHQPPTDVAREARFKFNCQRHTEVAHCSVDGAETSEVKPAPHRINAEARAMGTAWIVRRAWGTQTQRTGTKMTRGPRREGEARAA